LQARRAGSILTYVTREASAARREIGRETPPSVVFCEMSVTFEFISAYKSEKHQTTVVKSPLNVVY